MKIEVHKKGKSRYSGFLLFLDGKEVFAGDRNSFYRLTQHGDSGTFELHIDNEELISHLLGARVEDLIGIISSFQTGEKFQLDLFNYSYFYTLSDKDKPWITFNVGFAAEKWNKPWTLEDLSSEMDDLSELVRPNGYVKECEFNDFMPYSIEIDFLVENPKSTLNEELSRCLPSVIELIKIAESSLHSKINENSLVSQFNFPAAFRSACEEYLWSFVQFLKDVGVEATAELKHEHRNAGQVLFSVTPKDGKEMLCKIREALDLYLNLAGTTNFASDPDTSIQVDRLEARILSFQSQLRFANAEARLQAATIEQQQATIRAQETTALAVGMAMGTISAENVFLLTRVEKLEKEKKERKTFEFFNGLIIIDNPKIKGISVNLSVLLPAVKRVMRGEQAFPPNSSSALPDTDLSALPHSEPPALPPTDTEK